MPTKKPLADHRREHMVTMRDLSAAAGVCVPTIIRIEHRRAKPHYRTMRKIAAALNVGVRDIQEFDHALASRISEAA